ncbi:MAG: EAL domain-containing protein [bacterium]|nr:EAL domain-containing protein [bacterium]
MRVLTVVDEAAARQQLEDFFHRRHHELTVCGGVDEARAALAETSYAFVLIDLEQDPTGALELCHELKSRQAFVLVVSKEQSPESIRAALEAGADDCLIKPLTPTALQLRLAVGHRSLSARKRSVRTAQDSQQRLRTLLETMREGVFQVDRQGKIELANSRLSRMTGYTLDELVGRSADEILVAPSVREKLPGQTLLGSGTGSEQYTIPLATQSGEPIWVKLTAAPMSTGGAAAGSLGVVQDITEQRQAEESLRFREEYFRVLLENASDLISIIDLDGTILYQSLSSERLLGRGAEDLVGQDFHQLLHEDDRESFAATLHRTLGAAGITAAIRIRLRHREAHWCHFESLCNNLIQNPVVGGIVVTSRDVAERHKVEAALQRERALFQQLFRNSPAGIVILNNDDRVVDANRGFSDLFQFSVEEMVGKQLGDLIVPPDLRGEATQLSKLVFDRQSVNHETLRQRKDGSRVDVSIVGYPIELAEGTGAFGLYTDITERKRAERRLFHDAFHDPLTGLPNRTLLAERLERDLRRAKRRTDYRFALLFIDLDRFKEINDSLGHAAGDEVLIETARRLEGCLRPGDTTARLAGDEFIIILEDVQGVADTTRVAERALAALARPFESAGQTVEISGSLGMVFSSPSYDNAEGLIRDADIAMYRAKRRGSGRYEIFDKIMQRSAVERQRLESDLARAIERQEQVLHFQPIVSLADGGIVAFEALVRWRHPDRGLLGPAELISAAESTGLIAPLGRWILEQACRQIVDWRGRFPQCRDLRINVNLSEHQLLAPDFLQDIDKVFSGTDARPDATAFEIKESLLVDAPESIAALWQLRKRGCRLQLDNFGTGHTSLGELYRSPIETLKIDRSFISRMKPGGEDVELVRAASLLGTSLGLTVLAEGVETEAQLKQIRELGITHAQGYFFSRPLPSEAATALLTEDPRW